MKSRFPQGTPWFFGYCRCFFILPLGFDITSVAKATVDQGSIPAYRSRTEGSRRCRRRRCS